ncbi:peptidoglycan/LPS O-acetylase OafA/YrhL [Bradyrhizobium sp. USDA 4532]|uniref:acyltransferase family protein n=1 Tax=unclassified Bradyrhizobium TaxID=2631580 RepID=UPI00209F8466|nr:MULTISPECIES: acyltransferase [unclassified Bradyrhizobium]MCP1831707.1 peptidoglycan/LPS O-acetylase OafA/YrhL [Bradyrhizobium sp. USDA 4545]MCP1916544.1 peptidoglycan/LPS O-acetylase OafA/YrhL [Bradyrhizobium sp. USDA 4532]
MGTYRLFLAFCVLYAHAFGEIAGWHIGVVAVISFFIISGYVMSLLILKHYTAPTDFARFYLDRAARLFPQYLFYLGLTLLTVKLLGITNIYLQDRGPVYVAANSLILPVGYYMFGLDHALYLPQAWSLGLELTFYLTFPVFWHSPKALKIALACASMLIFAAAIGGIVDTDRFGYRLLPGVFFIFVTGSALAKREWTFVSLTGIATLAAMLLILAMPTLYAVHYNKEVVAGIIVGIPAVYLLSKMRFSGFDELLGNLSYGVFLNHFLLIWIADHFDVSRVLMPFASLAMAWVSYSIIEQPALHLRRRLRDRRALGLQQRQIQSSSAAEKNASI